MSGTHHMNNEPEQRSPRESGEDSEDESEILEESPCGRWLKRREEVEQRDVPGIDCAYLAMDTEEGVEVVWNEVQFSERRNFKEHEEKIQQVFENLTKLDHPNIVKFHRYWTDTHNDKPRVIFITEYMSSGSLKQFLKRTKRNVKRLPLLAWRRWCTQILSALSYLHSCTPPIIHGNLTCDTIFIQHNGLVKIGSVAPDLINHNVKTCQDDFKNIHFLAPELPGNLSPAADIYSFGVCALEMAALEMAGGNGGGADATSSGSGVAAASGKVTEETIRKTIESLEDEQQRDFIERCLCKEPEKRPTARELLFHPLLFEVHSLKLLAAHVLVKKSANISETITDELMQRWYGPDVIVAEVRRQSGEVIQMKMADIPVTEKLEKFVEDVKNGIYPLTAFAAASTGSSASRSRAISPTGAGAAPTTGGAGAPGDDADLLAGATQAGGAKAQSGDNGTVRADSPEPPEVETRKVVNMMCDVKAREDGCDDLMLTIVLRMDDKMNRQLTSCIAPSDNPKLLAQELVHFGFINEDDRDKIASLIEETLQNQSSSGNTSPTHGFQLTAPITVATSQTTPLVNSVPPLTNVNSSTPTQVPMHSTS